MEGRSEPRGAFYESTWHTDCSFSGAHGTRTAVFREHMEHRGQRLGGHQTWLGQLGGAAAWQLSGSGNGSGSRGPRQMVRHSQSTPPTDCSHKLQGRRAEHMALWGLQRQGVGVRCPPPAGLLLRLYF